MITCEISRVLLPGWLKDYLSSWNVSWYISGACMILSAFLVISDGCLKHEHQRQQEVVEPPQTDNSPTDTKINCLSRSVNDIDNKTSEEEIPMLNNKQLNPM